MRILKYAGSPFLFISLYLLLLFEGEHFGGFYIIYLLLALPHGTNYSLLSILGITLLVISSRMRTRVPRFILMLVSVVIMVISIIVFVNQGMVNPTFSLKLPVFLFCLWGVCCCCLVIYESLWLLNGRHHD